MMTPLERAEKILNKLYNFEFDDGKFLIPWIVNQIEEAVTQSIIQRSKEAKINYEKGFNKAKEKAARIVSTKLFESLGKDLPAEDWLAQRIREMEME